LATTSVPIDLQDETNVAILRVAEDRLEGFIDDPIGTIAERSGIDADTVIERLRAMLEAGTVRRVRQTLRSTKLAAGALVAWKVPPEKLDAAFDYMFRDDPFSGHVVLRSTDAATPGSSYRLWTTLKVPQGYSLEKHCAHLASRVGAEAWRIMPAKCLFVLGVGHVRRRDVEPGSRLPDPADVTETTVTQLSEEEWRVLEAVKREFEPYELCRDIWQPRADEACLPLPQFLEVARRLERLGVIGRFSAFLEHVKPVAGGERVTLYNALFHWAVPAGRELDAGREIGRHDIMTHAYWREAGPEFGNVNVMGVTHGLKKDTVMEHKAAIDAHLREAGIEVGYTNVFWGGRSEIKPSEVMPSAYVAWCAQQGIDPATMRDEA
jgi:DNA-binding Lrp family transcriptional regulator